MKYAIDSGTKAKASATLKISHKDAVKFCRVINRKKFADAKKTLEDIVNKRVTLNGKTYDNINKEMIMMLHQVEMNGRKNGLDVDSMFLFVSTHRGPTMHRNRRRWRKFGSRMKSCHVQMVLSESSSFAKRPVFKKKETVEKSE
ncbi:MAG: uL22 family ribosomal protein [Candidatus Aenigmatarchaeota archaeon]